MLRRVAGIDRARPAAGTLAAQQKTCNRFREEFNGECPHEALDQQMPGSVYRSSERERPNMLLPLEYPDRFEVRYVSAHDGMRWNSDGVTVSIVYAGESVGLEEIDAGI
jgi:putative transposase